MTAMMYAPFPDRESARSAAKQLLSEKLIACANVLGEIESLFVWEDRPDSSTEIGVIFKTDSTLLDRASERLGELHPYDTPAILGWRCESSAPKTRDWLAGLRARDANHEVFTAHGLAVRIGRFHRCRKSCVGCRFHHLSDRADAARPPG